MGFVVGNDGAEEKRAEPELAPEIVVEPEEPAPVPISVQGVSGSSLPNWMPAPVPVENGGNNVVSVTATVTTPVRVTTRSGAVTGGVSNGVASGPKKRGRPRKYY